MSYQFRIFAQKTVKKAAQYLGDQYVLVIDPSANYRSSIKQFLSNLHIKKVLSVSTVKEAKRQMLTHRVGLMIVEWLSEHENGLQFCRSLQNKQNSKWIPYLLLSGENLRQDIVLASEVGIDAYLLKPFSYEDFVIKLHQLISAALEPNPVTMILQTADLAFLDGDLEKAAQTYQAVLKGGTPSARALKGLAEIALGERNLSRAESYCSQALTHNPEYLAAHRTLLTVYQAQKNHPKILEKAAFLNRSSPDNPKYTLILAAEYLLLHELDQSEKYFLRTIQIAPSLAESYKGIGSIALERKNNQKAEHYFQKALDIDKRDVSTLNSLGLAYINLGQFEKGLQKYRLALSIQGRDHRILFNIAQAYEKSGELEKALQYFEYSLQAEPGFEKARRGLKNIRLRKQRQEKKSLS